VRKLHKVSDKPTSTLDSRILNPRCRSKRSRTHRLFKVPVIKIGVTSQNFRTITGHAGKTRRFFVYESQSTGFRELDRLDLPPEMAIHSFQGGPHPLDDLDVLITASCGQEFVQRMAARQVRVLATSETDPLRAVTQVVAGTDLPPPLPHEHHKGSA